MFQFLSGLLFLSGLPICMFLLPTSWWPWSTLVWFIGFILLEGAIASQARRVAGHWRGRQLPVGPSGIAIGIAISIDDSCASSTGGDSDGGGDGGGGD